MKAARGKGWRVTLSPLWGEKTYWVVVFPGVARETRLPRATLFHAFSVKTRSLITHDSLVLAVFLLFPILGLSIIICG